MKISKPNQIIVTFGNAFLKILITIAETIISCLALASPVYGHSISHLNNCYSIVAGTTSNDEVIEKYNDNIVISNETRHFEFITNSGKPVSIKEKHNITYTARNSEDIAYVIKFYGGKSKIIKASASGTKPRYRTYESNYIFYDGSRVCFMAMPVKKEKDSKVRFELTHEDPTLFTRIFLKASNFTKVAETRITIPAELSNRIKVIPYGLLPCMKFTQENNPNGEMVYKVISQNQPSYIPLPDSPDPNIAIPQLFITGYFSDVTDLYHYISGYLPDESVNIDDKVKALAADLKSKADSPHALIDSTTAWVRSNIRYYAIEDGDNAFAPAPAANVLARRSGDCKGSANLIKTLLRLNGIDGRVAWIGTKGSSPFGWKEMPTVCTGNHMIAVALINDSIIYLDGTPRHAYDGFVPAQIRGREALIENGDYPILKTVPSDTNSDDVFKITADYKIASDALHGIIRHDYSGALKVAVESSIEDVTKSQRDEFIRHIVTIGRNNSMVDLITVSTDRKSPVMSIIANISEIASVKETSGKIYINLQPIRDFQFDFVNTKDRTCDYKKTLLYRCDFKYTVTIPENLTPRHIPEKQTIDNQWFESSLSYEYSNGKITCNAHIQPKTDIVALADIDKYNTEIRKIKQLSNAHIILEKLP